MADKEATNMKKNLRWRYIMSVEVRSLNNYLFVIEGEDIWMVYNGSSSCLNVELWDLRFSFPTIISALRAVESGT